MKADPRNRELGRIHILKKDLGLDDDQYRVVLWTVARVDSSRDLDSHGRQQVIAHLESHAKRAGVGQRKTRQTPADGKAPMVGKIRALLINAPGGRRDDAYADAMSQHMFQVARFTWCTPDQLHKLVSALIIDLKRTVGRAAPADPG